MKDKICNGLLGTLPPGNGPRLSQGQDKTLSSRLSGIPGVRLRTYSPGLARWLTKARMEEMLAGEHPYGYANNNPTTYTDPSGLSPFKCERCAYSLAGQYFITEIHWCCHEYVHCLICCILNHEFDSDCAINMQNRQAGDPIVKANRLKWCKVGIVGNVDTARCGDHCKANTPPCRKGKNCPNPPKSPYWPGGGVLPPECYNCSPFARFGIPPFGGIIPIWP